MDFKLYCHLVPFFDVFRLADARLDGYKITPVFWEKGCGELGFPDPHMDRNHPPAVGNQIGDILDHAAVLRWNSDKEPRGRSAPEDDLAAEFDVHEWSISKAGITSWDINSFYSGLSFPLGR